MRRRIAVSIAGGVASLLALPPLWIAVNLRDLPAADDADLEVPLPPGIAWSSMDELEVVEESLYWPEGTDDRLRAITAREAWDPDFVRSLLGHNREAYAALDRVLAGSPLVFEVGLRVLDDPGIDRLFSIGRLVQLANAEAQLLEREGERRAALERTLLGMRAGRKVSEAHGINLIAIVTAASFQSRSLLELEWQVRSAPFTSLEATALAAELHAQTPEPNAWSRSWAAEYQFVNASIGDADGWLGIKAAGDLPFEEDSLAVHVLGWLPGDYVLHPNRTRNALVGWYRDLQLRSARACGRTVDAGESLMHEAEPLAMRAVLLPNPLGRRIIDNTPHLLRFETRRCHHETRIALVRAQIALKAFWDEHHELPETLDELVPRFLDDVPIDGFGGASLRYSKARAVVCSIGSDETPICEPDSASQREATQPAIRVAF